MPNKESAKQQIRELLEKYDKVVKEGRFHKYNEEMTKAEFIEPLFEALGWDVRNRTHTDEVTREEKVSKGWVDYGFRIDGIPKFFLEAKPLKADLDNPKYVEQSINYAWHKGCTWAILTDFEAIKIFNAEWKTANLFQSRFISLDCNQFLEQFDELWLLSKDSFEQGLLNKEAEKYGKKSKKSPVGEQLFSDLTKWRSELSKDILQRNKGIKEVDLDETVQRIIDRLIFIRNCEDRELEPPTLLSTMREWDSKRKGSLAENIVKVFKHFDDEYNSKLFQPHLCDDLDVSNQVLGGIIKELYHTKDRTIKYDFAVLDADILGNVYEQYLGHILKKTAKRATLEEKHAYRKEQGIYYTPTYIVDYIVKNTLGELLKDKKADVEKIRVLDPACGSGSFLIKAFDVLNKFYSKKEGDRAQTQLDLDTGLPFKKKEKTLLNNIFGVDLDAKAVEIAQLNLLLKIAEKKQRLPLLQKNIKCGNSLINDEKVAGDKAFKWEREFKQIMDEGGFDVVIGNPPYVRLQSLDKGQIDYFYSNYKSAIKHYDIYTLFVEKGLSLLKKGGTLGFILPSKFFVADYGVGLRNLISGNKYLKKVVNFKDFQVFGKASTYTVLLFLKKVENSDFDYLEISNKNKLQKTKAISAEDFRHRKMKQPEKYKPWNFSADQSDKLMAKVKRDKMILSEISKDIFQGFLSGRDRFFFVNVLEDYKGYVKIKNAYDNKDHLIEKPLLKKLLKGKEIKRWQIGWKNVFLIYPYKEYEGNTRLIPIQELKSKYPKAYNYFLDYKRELMSSETSEAVDETNWYRFRRPRSIEQFEQHKILTQVLASRNSFTLDDKGEYYFVGGGNAGGFGIILKDEYSKDYLYVLTLLNSRVLEFYLKKISTPFRGGFYSYGKHFIEKMPIVFPSEMQKSRLAELAKKQLERNKRLNELGDKKTDERQRIEEEIKRTDAEIDELVYKLYGITEAEKKIIEESLK